MVEHIRTDAPWSRVHVTRGGPKRSSPAWRARDGRPAAMLAGRCASPRKHCPAQEKMIFTFARLQQTASKEMHGQHARCALTGGFCTCVSVDNSQSLFQVPWWRDSCLGCIFGRTHLPLLELAPYHQRRRATGRQRRSRRQQRPRGRRIATAHLDVCPQLRAPHGSCITPPGPGN